MPGPRPGGSGATGATGGPVGTPSLGSPGRTLPQGPGVTATTIKAGIAVAEDPNAGNNAFGITTADVHNLEDMYRAVVDDLNARGGVQGRKIELVVYKYGSNTTNDVYNQEACERFTKDNKVLVKFDGLGPTGLACLEKAGVTTFGGGTVSGYGQAEYAQYPHIFDVSVMDIDTQMSTVVDGLNAQGWLSGWNHLTGSPRNAAPYVGVLAYDIPYFVRAVENHALPRLRAAGVTRMETSYITPELQAGQADVQSTVLRFKTLGVDHVIFLDDSGGLMPLVFSINANSQGYFPRLGCDTGSCNQIVAEQMPSTTMRGAVLVGWSPLHDVPAGHDYVLPERVRCEKLMRSKNMDPFSRNDLNVMINVCNTVWFFEQAAKRAGPSLLNDTLVAGGIAAAASFSPANTFALRLTRTKRAGADAYRYATWDTNCRCFSYSGPVRRVGT